ncbi:MAG: hypothetical protein M3381_12035 [Actinomycetota bacterium]|nr:hypothetical protein [Actinomycetota bacterium]
MSRPRIPIGGYGEIAFLQRGKDKVEARTRFRDWDGQTRVNGGRKLTPWRRLKVDPLVAG